MQLEDLFTKYGTDKGIWGYTEVYEKYLRDIRDQVTNVLEIGICGFRDIPNNVVGASLFAWRDYFTNAYIYGLDNDGRFIFNDKPRIYTQRCDAYNRADLDHVMLTFGQQFDFICDDAVHDPLPQIQLCDQLWPFLRRGGVYAIEEACPYKMENGTLEAMVITLMTLHPDMKATEYSTGKPEHLLILEKAA